jgi:hypothetical protein
MAERREVDKMAEHTWRFFRAGGSEQVSLDTAEDIRALGELDQKLWVALACPVNGLSIDAATLSLIDADKDGRLRASEIIAAIKWSDKVFKDLGGLTKRSDTLPLSAIHDQTEEGKAVLATARRLLSEMGKPDAGAISVADTADATKLLDNMRFNGDGVVPAASAESDNARALIEDILSTVGGELDRSGEQGVSKGKLDAFFEALDAYLGWWDRAQSDAEHTIPLGDKTAAAVEAFAAVRPKIDDFFTRCDLAAFDPRATAHLIRSADDWAPVASRTISRADEDIASFPLAQIAPGAALPLKEGINPAWAARMAAFVELVVTPLLGADVTELGAAQWRELGQRFAAYEAWLGSKAGDVVEKLGLERLRVIQESGLRLKIEALIAEDESRRPEADARESVDRAVRYYRDLHQLLDNFVAFRDFYTRRDKAIFQAGTLFLDGRSCELCVRVEDAGKHAALATSSFVYLAYCDCVRKATGEKMTVAVAFTNGDSDFLVVGRNGVFYDRQGKDWDATITKIVEQPLSIRQAFWAPYKRLGKFISSQFEKYASDRDKAAEADMTSSATSAGAKVETAAKTPPPAKPAAGAAAPAKPAAPAAAPAAAAPAAEAPASPSAFDIGKFAGIFAAIGLAAGVIIAAITSLVAGFLALRVWQMPLAIGGILLLISAPSMLLAALKLRQRNLAPVLDASGWAINARARINIPFGASLTKVSKLPKNARVDVTDPYQDGRSPMGFYLFLVFIICGAAILWDMGLLKQWLNLDSLTPPPAVEAPATPPEAPVAPPAAP